MDDHWRLTVLGVRGSLPAAEAGFLGYGGNTACLRLDWGGGTVFLDAGSGLARRDIGPDGDGPVLLLLSHLHLDHILGLPGFGALHQPGQRVLLFGPDPSGSTLQAQLSTLLGPPFWPLRLEEFPAHIAVHSLTPGQSFLVEGDGGALLTVSTLAGRHPGGCLYYRLSCGDKRVVYALDCEPDEAMREALTQFAQGCDLLVWDAFFPPGEVRPGWGHSTWAEGLALGQAAGAKRVLMTHYARDCDDQALELQEQRARQAGGRCIFAKEGMVIAL